MSRDELLQRALVAMREVLLHPEWSIEETGQFVKQALPPDGADVVGMLFALVQLSLNDLRRMGFTAQEVEVWYGRALTEAMDMEMDDPGVGRGKEER
jgi:hypothetical protein